MTEDWHDQSRANERLIVRGPGVVGSPKCNVVATVHDPADRKLVIAAPDLLEALQGILDIGKRDMSNPKYDAYFRIAKEAIKKATE